MFTCASKVNISKVFLQIRALSCHKMACSRYEYVKDFELEDRIIPNCWIVVRIDGKSFHRFSKEHNFVKPNDEGGKYLIEELPQILNYRI